MFETTLDIVATRSYQVLHLITNHKKGLDFIWPHVLNFVMIPAYSPGLPVILKNLNSLLTKNCENALLAERYSTTKTKPNSHSLFLRLILICYVPFLFKNLGTEILNILPILFKHVDPTIKFPPTHDLLQLLSKYFKFNQISFKIESGSFKEEKLYYEKLDAFILNMISKIPNLSWCEALNQEIVENLHNYVANRSLLVISRTHNSLNNIESNLWNTWRSY